MQIFPFSRELVQTNRYDFVVTANTEAEAEEMLNKFLEDHCPAPFYGEGKVWCTDREADV